MGKLSRALSFLNPFGKTPDDEESSEYESAESEASSEESFENLTEANEEPAVKRRINIKEKEHKTPLCPTSSVITESGPSVNSSTFSSPGVVKTKSFTSFKNDLQTLCQRNKMKIPSYAFVAEGPAHAPRFKASVDVAGELFVSTGEYFSKGEAEQDAARNSLTFLCERLQGRNSVSNNLPDNTRKSPSKAGLFLPVQTAKYHQPLNSAQPKFNGFDRHDEKPKHISRAMLGYSGIDRFSKIVDSIPFDDGTNYEQSWAESVTGSASVPVKSSVFSSQVKVEAGSMRDDPINLTLKEDSDRSSPPRVNSTSVKSNHPFRFASTERPVRNTTLTGESPLQNKSSSKTSYSNSVRESAGESNKGRWDIVEIAGLLAQLQVDRGSGNSEALFEETREDLESWPPVTEHLRVLGTLDFATKAFPLLTRLNGRPLEQVFDLQDIEQFQDIDRDEINRYLWYLDGHTGDGQLDILSRKTAPPKGFSCHLDSLLYDCYVSPSGELRFKIAVNNQGGTLLQRELGFDKVLRVFFDNFPRHLQETTRDVYHTIFKNGIFVGNRLYKYFVHKPSDDSDEDRKTLEGTVKCYFVCTDSRRKQDLDDPNFKFFETIAAVRCMFMHIHTCPTVAKFIARLQLCLSKTQQIDMPWTDLVIRAMNDVPCQDPAAPGASFTDGTGFISVNLAKLLPTRVFKGMRVEGSQERDDAEDYPSLVQVRFFHSGAAHKGTLLACNKLNSNTITCYKSMRKVVADSSFTGSSISSFELVNTSRRPRRANLSQDLIVLLSFGGVPPSIFLDAVRKAIDASRMVLSDRERAYQELLDSNSDMAHTIRGMLAAGISLEEAGLRKLLIDVTKNRLTDFSKGKVPLERSYYLMGTADPTGTLEPNQVVVVLDNGHFCCKKMLVYRAPGKHPGDIHVVEGVAPPGFDKYVGYAKYVIFFSIKGTRPLPHEIAKGDLDGDLYWICENPKVVDTFTEWPERWVPQKVNSKDDTNMLLKPSELNENELSTALFEEYFNERFNKSSVVGFASTRWLAHADAYLHPDTPPEEKKIHMEEMLKYPDYIYEGVDIKSGVQLILPKEHRLIRQSARALYLMKRPPPPTAGHGVVFQEKRSRSILGHIYEMGQTAQEDWRDPEYQVEDFELDPTFDVPNSDQHVTFWSDTLVEYNKEMNQALNVESDAENYDPDLLNRIKLRYKQMLYGAPSFDETENKLCMVREHAAAIYKVVYRKAMADCPHKKPSVSFAWTVAGAALCDIFAKKVSKGRSEIWSPFPYRQVHRPTPSSARRPVQF